MNPFATNQHADFQENEMPRQPLFPVFNSPRQTLVDQPSKVEQAINRASDALERSFKMLAMVAGILCIIAFFPPFLRFLYEFSAWTFKKVGWLFS